MEKERDWGESGGLSGVAGAAKSVSHSFICFSK